MSSWERILWRQQPYPDNYVPPSFLSSLSKNRAYCLATLIHHKFKYPNPISPLLSPANFIPYTYWPLVLGSCAIAQHLSTIFIFLSVFVRLFDHSLDPRLLVTISAAMFMTGYTIWEILDYLRGTEFHSSLADRREFTRRVVSYLHREIRILK